MWRIDEKRGKRCKIEQLAELVELAHIMTTRVSLEQGYSRVSMSVMERVENVIKDLVPWCIRQ